ncbi:MAG: hypothetical protein CVU39_08635 [Chloroflexi bacterium HGW-Chloroflexi-10]|nr:MAG: hypothetical protein CVU39_08635 [Chloroflexi bacterium HGW-Chloroflexi-10]
MLLNQDPMKHSDPMAFLLTDYQHWVHLYKLQSKTIQRFLDIQARNLSQYLIKPLHQFRFNLPDQVICGEGIEINSHKAQIVPAELREQTIGGLFERLNKNTINVTLRETLNELEASINPAVATSAGLIRFTTAMYLVYNQLPEGRTVHYHTAEDEEIPSIPNEDPSQHGSAITEATDAIVEEEQQSSAETVGELQVPYVPAARRFYLPQWVAFDAEDRLLVSSLEEGETYIHSMQEFLHTLHLAVSLGSYMLADEQYQRKRYGILGQLVNQGRAMARFETKQIISTIQKRALDNTLNRGLSLSLPYFDDQTLVIKTYEFQVIPAGRIMFVPAFVVRASRHEQAKVAQDTRLSPSTRNHLLILLELLENAFSDMSA